MNLEATLIEMEAYGSPFLSRATNGWRCKVDMYADGGSSYPWRVDQTNYHLHTNDLTHWMPLQEAPK